MTHILPLLLALACTSSSGPVPVFVPDGPSLYDAPWPSDLRRDDDGTVRVSGMLGAEDVHIFQTYLAIAEQETGFGTNSPIYVRFDAPLDTTLLPSAHQSLQPDSPVYLLNIDDGSAEWGQRTPISWEFWEEATAFLPGNLLAVAPTWGAPLRPRTTYALVITTDIAAPNPEFSGVWSAEHPLHDHYAHLADALFFQHQDLEKVAVATVFTTGDPLASMRSLAGHVQQHLAPAALEQTLTHLPEDDTLHYAVYEGRYQSPVYQHGDRPYALQGGGFEWDADGQPVIYDWDHMRMAVCTPKDLSSPPPGGWPVVFYAHGTGGDYRTFCDEGGGLEPASVLARAGFIGVGIDQPLHGTRATPGTIPEQHWFNFMNPSSGRANFLQAAIDAIFLARAFAAAPLVLHTDDGPDLPVDSSKLYFYGHSQGGIAGAIALPWLSQDVDAAVLSGTGGGVGITLVERVDPIDIAANIEALLQFGPDDHLTEHHPVTGLVQWLVEQTDPLNYGPYYIREEGGWPGQRPVSLLVTSGSEDAATHFRATAALAGAARIPVISPTFYEPEIFSVRGINTLAPPVTGDLVGFDGSVVTAGLSQWEGGSHWVVFEESNAAKMVQDFFVTARDDDHPTINPYR